MKKYRTKFITNEELCVVLTITTMYIYNTKCTKYKLRLEEFYSYTEKIQQKRTRKTNKTKENYVQQTTIYNNHIDTQQINSSGTAYLFMC